MSKPEQVETHWKIYGNGLLSTSPSPGVDPNWKYDDRINNYVFVGKPDAINSEITSLEQSAERKAPEIKELALIR